jgi:hypothetical protein
VGIVSGSLYKHEPDITTELNENDLEESVSGVRSCCCRRVSVCSRMVQRIDRPLTSSVHRMSVLPCGASVPCRVPAIHRVYQSWSPANVSRSLSKINQCLLDLMVEKRLKDLAFSLSPFFTQNNGRLTQEQKARYCIVISSFIFVVLLVFASCSTPLLRAEDLSNGEVWCSL